MLQKRWRLSDMSPENVDDVSHVLSDVKRQDHPSLCAARPPLIDVCAARLLTRKMALRGVRQEICAAIVFCAEDGCTGRK